MPEHFWCPDRLSTDGHHRYCIKAESGYVKRLAEIELWSLRYGRNYACSLDEGKPLMEWTEDDFRNGGPETPVSVSEGYQQKSLVTADGGLVISYLRNDTPYPVMTDAKDGTKTESFCLRTQTPRPVTVDLHDPSFRYELLDLETGCTCIVPAGKTFLGITDHDFAVVAERIPV